MNVILFIELLTIFLLIGISIFCFWLYEKSEYKNIGYTIPAIMALVFSFTIWLVTFAPTNKTCPVCKQFHESQHTQVVLNYDEKGE